MTREMHMGDIVRHFKEKLSKILRRNTYIKYWPLPSTRGPAKSWWCIRRCMLRSKFAPVLTLCL